jgi:thioredoxin reductase
LPNTGLVDKFNPEKDTEWCLVVDKRQETSIPWIFAAWDITTNSNKVRQTLTSAAEWAIAADSIHEEIMKGE